ncbi:MAG: TonB-dependent receptor [Proteobacteria bacterium]|nr:TonB-dependent receptor [Pseudomonadota bacterium]
MISRKFATAVLCSGIAWTALSAPALAQDIAGSGSAPEAGKETQILVTGSRLKQDPNNSALPLQIIKLDDLSREGIASAEQAIMYLNANGNGADNLASNADVISTAAANRGANGAAFANLRGQGAASTLVLLNGRRVAAHGLSGAAVDVNQIPFAAIDRIEVLKDGASAIYGTDAVGGVINYITKKNYTGIGLQGSADVTQEGGGNIYRLSGIAGWGNLDESGFNVMAAVGYNWTKPLRGDQRDFVNLFQYDRALAPETRGSPFATIVPLAGTIIPSAGAAPFMPGSTTQRVDAINVMNLPGKEGCGAIPGQGAYDWQAWNIPNYRYACAFDSARSAYLQQQQNTLTYLGRAVARLGAHELALEVTGSDAQAHKVYSEIQLTPNTTTQNYTYRRIAGVNDATYDMVYDRLIAVFPTLGARGTPIAYRWRCLECGPREVETKTTTFRIGASAEGPVMDGWDYHAGVSYADSKSHSVLGGGFYYTSKLIAALNTGVINPFLLPGQTQSQAALDLLAGASAAGEQIYQGKYSVFQADASVAGRLFALPGGDAQLAVGLDYRKEKYRFSGNLTTVYSAPTDNANNIAGVSREVKSAYAEISFPVITQLELTAAARIDDYSGFGSTTNPKFTAKFTPTQGLMLRASYNTAFRVPSFNQLFNGRSSTVYTGTNLIDPATCPSLVPASTGPCARISGANQITGGNPDLKPETAKEANIGVVIQPSRHFSISFDWWMINRKNTIQIFSLTELEKYYSSLSDRFKRDTSGAITGFDLSWANAGQSKTQGIDVAMRAGGDAWGGRIAVGLDGTYLLQKKDRVVDSVAYLDKLGTTMPGGLFSPSGDLGLRWKHNAYVTWSNDDWMLSFSQLYRSGYTNRVLPGVTAGTATRTDVVYTTKPYIIYNTSVAYTGISNIKLTAGIKNLFNTDPPFAISYDDNTGGGSSWEPRVADPRGRSFTLQAEVKF